MNNSEFVYPEDGVTHYPEKSSKEQFDEIDKMEVPILIDCGCKGCPGHEFGKSPAVCEDTFDEDYER